MTSEQSLSEPDFIVQLPRDGALDRSFRASPPLLVTSGRVVLEHLAAEDDGRLGPPEGAEVVLTVPSPEALTRQAGEIRDVLAAAPDRHRPLVIIVEAAEEFREDELAAVRDAAVQAPQPVILRVMADA
jgi:hypothetical protein